MTLEINVKLLRSLSKTCVSLHTVCSLFKFPLLENPLISQNLDMGKQANSSKKTFFKFDLDKTYFVVGQAKK